MSSGWEALIIIIWLIIMCKPQSAAIEQNSTALYSECSIFYYKKINKRYRPLKFRGRDFRILMRLKIVKLDKKETLQHSKT
uniref:Uncharacterized protein n=1 Tax=Panagrolaimus sp. JU765 TaxID=591449 RepID=A0AC34Q2P3_9BILA